jgi:transcriptional antiterminator RfaH
MEQWYTLYTEPNAEYLVTKALAQRQVHTYLPELEFPKKHPGRKPFFPCYLFARIDFNLVGLSTVWWTPGLRRVIAFGGEPTPVPDEVIQLIQQILAEIKQAGGWLAHSFHPGETVRITEGPFKDMVAIFDGPTRPARRVQVMLNLLGHARRLQIQPDNLAKATPEVEVLPPLSRGTRGKGRRIKGKSILESQ